MTTSRNEETEAGKRIWQMVDEAARRAPQWIQDSFASQTEQQRASLQQQPLCDKLPETR
jgi:hypothetical protein